MKTRDPVEKIASSDNPAAELRLVDSYIQQRRKIGRQFVMPTPHQFMLPLLDRYDDLGKFTQWAKKLRDEVPAGSAAYLALHEFYRTLEVRCVQQQRRERAKRALTWLEANYPKAGYEAKMRWMRKLEQRWGRDRLAYLRTHRSKTHDNRLSTAEREELLVEFWQGVDKSITNGDLPPL